MRRYWPVLVLVAATLLIGCGGGTAALKTGLAGNGAAADQLSVSVPTIDFGNVTVGSRSARTGILTAGSTTVTISSASWTGLGYSVSGITFPVTLPAGQSMPFTVTFTPQVAGMASGGISFISDASNSPTTQTLTGMGIQARTSGHSVDLLWTPSPSMVIGYNIYRGTASGGPYAWRLNSSPQPTTGFVDTTVASGGTYFYVATAVDQNSVESTYSNEITAVIP